MRHGFETGSIETGAAMTAPATTSSPSDALQLASAAMMCPTVPMTGEEDGEATELDAARAAL